MGQWRSIVGSKQHSDKVELVYKSEHKDPRPKITKPIQPVATSSVTEELKVDIPAIKETKGDATVKSEIMSQQPEISSSTPIEGLPENSPVKPIKAPQPESTLTEIVGAPGPENTLTEPVASELKSSLTEPVGAPGRESTLIESVRAPESVEVHVNNVTHPDPEIVQQEEKSPMQVCTLILLVYHWQLFPTIINYCTSLLAAVFLQPLYPVESVVGSVRDETEKVAEKILSEQVKDHQNSQSIGEQWMQDTAKVKNIQCT